EVRLSVRSVSFGGDTMQLRSPVFWLAAAALLATTISAGAADITIFTIGTSYINGFEIGPNEKFSVKLQAALVNEGYNAEVVDIGYKDDMTKLALRWMKSEAGTAILSGPPGRAFIVELGGNDCPFYTLEETTSNLDAILALFEASKIPVLLVGTE